MITCESCCERFTDDTSVVVLVEHARAWHKRKYHEAMFQRGPVDRSEIALAAARAGHWVFPTRDRFQTDVPPIFGFSNRYATREPGIIRKWWAEYPHAGVGLLHHSKVPT